MAFICSSRVGEWIAAYKCLPARNKKGSQGQRDQETAKTEVGRLSENDGVSDMHLSVSIDAIVKEKVM